MRRNTRDWLVLAMCLAVEFSLATFLGFVAAHFTVRPPWAEFLSEVLAVIGIVSLAFALCVGILLVIKRSTVQPSQAATGTSGLRAVPTDAHPKPRMSKMAILSLVLAAPPVSCFYRLPAVAGFVLGIVALHSIHASGGRIKGAGLAIAGTALSFLSVALALCGILFIGPD